MTEPIASLPPATTRNMPSTVAEIRNRVDITEQAKKENFLWFASYKDISQLDERLTNFSTWQMAIKTACEEQNCIDILESAPKGTDKLGLNNCKNVNLIIAHSIHEDIKIFVLNKTARASFKAIYKLRPKPNEQSVQILAKVSRMDSVAALGICLANRLHM